MNRRIKRQLNRKTAILAIALIVMMVAAVAGTLALLSKNTDTKVNTFTPNELTCEVLMNTVYGYPERIRVINTGDTQGYIRAIIVANWVVDDESDPDNGAIYSEKPVENVDYNLNVNSSGVWTRIDDYFYYNKKVYPGKETDDIAGSVKQLKKKSGYRLKFTVLAQIIQSDPASAVQDAWRVKYNGSDASPVWESL